MPRDKRTAHPHVPAFTDFENPEDYAASSGAIVDAHTLHVDNTFFKDAENTSESAFRAAAVAAALKPFPGYFETQHSALCGLHALNNGIGSRYLDESQMEQAVKEYIDHAAREQLLENAADHHTAFGDYSEAVLTFALQWHRNEYSLNVNSPVPPTEPECLQIFAPNVAAVIVNKNNYHWVALKVVLGEIWLLDSQFPPEHMSQESYQKFLLEHPTAYPLMILSPP